MTSAAPSSPSEVYVNMSSYAGNHDFIICTKEYHDFSKAVFGEYMHHNPSDTNSPITNEEVRSFILSYKKYYGPISPLWYYKLNKQHGKEHTVIINNQKTNLR